MKSLKEDYLEILACPECRGNLRFRGGMLTCVSCANSYPVQNGIPILLPKSLENEFVTAMRHWDCTYKNDSSNPKDPLDNLYNQDAIEHINRFWHHSGDDLFLEAGCGTADIARSFARQGRKIVGIDFSINALLAAKKIFDDERLDYLFVCGDLAKLPFKDGKFAFLYAGGSIEHFEDTRSSVFELNRVMKRGATLTALVPVVSISMLTYGFLYGNLPEIPLVFQLAKFIHHKLLRGRFAMYGYEKSFTVKGIKKIFQAAGLTEIDTGYYNTYYEIKMFKSELLKNVCRWLLVKRPFWPMIYVNGRK